MMLLFFIGLWCDGFSFYGRAQYSFINAGSKSQNYFIFPAMDNRNFL